MSTFSNLSKAVAATVSNLSKTVSTWSAPKKAGYSWQYDQLGINYDSMLDENSHNPVYYDSEGTLPVIVNVQKH